MYNRPAWLGLAAVVLAVGAAAWFFRGLHSTPGKDSPVSVSSRDRGVARPATPGIQGPGSAAPAAPPKALQVSASDSNSTADSFAPAAGLAPGATAGSVDLPPEIRRQVEHFKDPSVDENVCLRELEDLAARADAASIEILKALGSEHTYLNSAAVEMLGKVKGHADLADYLRGKLTDPDPRVLSAAVQSMAQQQGVAAVGEIEKVIQDNRQRPDGFQDMVCAASVRALADTKSTAAIPVLDAELRETVGPILNHDYGSQVVAALLAIGDSKAQPVLLAYADRLSEMLTRSDANPMGRAYIEAKIKEAREAAALLEKSLQP